MLWPKKNSYEEFDTKKKFLRLEHSPSPYNFSNGPSLMLREWGTKKRFCLVPSSKAVWGFTNQRLTCDQAFFGRALRSQRKK